METINHALAQSVSKHTSTLVWFPNRSMKRTGKTANPCVCVLSTLLHQERSPSIRGILRFQNTAKTLSWHQKKGTKRSQAPCYETYQLFGSVSLSYSLFCVDLLMFHVVARNIGNPTHSVNDSHWRFRRLPLSLLFLPCVVLVVHSDFRNRL